MNTRLCAYDLLTPEQRVQLHEVKVHAEQIAFCGTVESALHSLPRQPHPAITAFVLLVDDRPVAFLLLKRYPFLAHWADADSATLHALQVDERLQGHGLGKICLHALPDAVRQIWPEIRQLMLSVSPFNACALAFYLSRGWVESGDAYRGERRLIFTLPPVPGEHQQAS